MPHLSSASGVQCEDVAKRRGRQQRGNRREWRKHDEHRLRRANCARHPHGRQRRDRIHAGNHRVPSGSSAFSSAGLSAATGGATVGPVGRASSCDLGGERARRDGGVRRFRPGFIAGGDRAVAILLAVPAAGAEWGRTPAKRSTCHLYSPRAPQFRRLDPCTQPLYAHTFARSLHSQSSLTPPPPRRRSSSRSGPSPRSPTATAGRVATRLEAVGHLDLVDHLEVGHERACVWSGERALAHALRAAVHGRALARLPTRGIRGAKEGPSLSTRRWARSSCATSSQPAPCPSTPASRERPGRRRPASPCRRPAQHRVAHKVEGELLEGGLGQRAVGGREPVRAYPAAVVSHHRPADLDLAPHLPRRLRGHRQPRAGSPSFAAVEFWEMAPAAGALPGDAPAGGPAQVDDRRRAGRAPRAQK